MYIIDITVAFDCQENMSNANDTKIEKYYDSGFVILKYVLKWSNDNSILKEELGIPKKNFCRICRELKRESKNESIEVSGALLSDFCGNF